ncbi:uncharacterized protein [Trachinotus anak]|uniref:uncharacterized protein n=1 Tax=Trachinotus anak TaxID=443729 RepID=UPI0039F2424F
MGHEMSREDYERISLFYYETSLNNPCLLPDVGIDESLLKYSGTDSNAVLQAYSNQLVSLVPGYVRSLGSALGSFTPIPNAVGLGALVISMIIEICQKSSTQTNDNTYSMLQRVFGEEKASAVRDTMAEYLKRHTMFIKNEQRLQMELHRLEAQLSGHLTILKNSLLLDGQMRSRGLKIWVNGASFHIQMLIHEARLIGQSGQPVSNKVETIKAAINLYLQDLDNLLNKYKTFKISDTNSNRHQICGCGGFACGCGPISCYLRNREGQCGVNLSDRSEATEGCGNDNVIKAYINHFFTKYQPILGLRSHFLDMKNNLNSAISQHFTFTPPYTT